MAGNYVTVYGTIHASNGPTASQGAGHYVLDAKGISFWSDPSDPIWGQARNP
jgi:hypothetical protein